MPMLNASAQTAVAPTTAGASQIVIGTDFGFPIASSTPVDAILQTPGLTPDEQVAILGGNAERLLKLKT